MNITINLAEFGGVIAALLVVGAILKNAFPNIPNRIIPLITWVLGVVAYLALSDGWSEPTQWIAAVVAAATATGTHSGLKNSLGKSGGDGSLSALALALTLGLGLTSGCGLLQKDKFEPGGAYSQSATAAAMPELFVMDSSFDLAYSALDTTFKFERNNRTMLWAISPNIKHTLDKLRVEASRVKLDYAIARQAYLANSIQTNLDALTTALTKLQAINIAALTVIQTKGL